jgi:hypothetical protein
MMTLLLVHILCWWLDISRAVADSLLLAVVEREPPCRYCGLRGTGDCTTCLADARLAEAFGRRDVVS